MQGEYPWKDRLAGVGVTATVFRDDRSAALAALAELSFDGCKLTSNVQFRVGERLRLHQRGQGWIESEVEWTSGNCAIAKFLPICRS